MWTRRKLLCSVFVAAAAMETSRSFALPSSGQSASVLFDRAKIELERHGAHIPFHDVIGVVDFAAPSRIPRFHLLDMAAGKLISLLVAHGKGSDPAHSGWLHSFSNVPGSEATSSGSYLTSATYIGRHGQSRRLIGLDPENDEAENRAIVIHGAEYVSRNIIETQGKLGRSQGCFAVAPTDLAEVIERLGEGRLLLSTK